MKQPSCAEPSPSTEASCALLLQGQGANEVVGVGQRGSVLSLEWAANQRLEVPNRLCSGSDRISIAGSLLIRLSNHKENRKSRVLLLTLFIDSLSSKIMWLSSLKSDELSAHTEPTGLISTTAAGRVNTASVYRANTQIKKSDAAALSAART